MLYVRVYFSFEKKKMGFSLSLSNYNWKSYDWIECNVMRIVVMLFKPKGLHQMNEWMTIEFNNKFALGDYCKIINVT